MQLTRLHLRVIQHRRGKENLPRCSASRRHLEKEKIKRLRQRCVMLCLPQPREKFCEDDTLY